MVGFHHHLCGRVYFSCSDGCELAGSALQVCFHYYRVRNLDLYGETASAPKYSLSWRPTQGRILSSEVKKEYLRSGSGPGNSGTTGDITVYRPRVEYSYEYHGTSYQSKRIITVYINWPKKEAEAVVSRYPAEASVTVWVNSENPYQAVLERGIRNYKMKFTWAIIIGFSFLVAGARAGLFFQK